MKERILHALQQSPHTRQQLATLTGLCDRSVRETIASMMLECEDYMIVATSDKSGYRITTDTKEILESMKEQRHRIIMLTKKIDATKRVYLKLLRDKK